MSETMYALPQRVGPPLVGDPIAAGVALVAADTGRVLMIQRAMIDGEQAAGKWEFPGGTLEAGEDPLEGALREFAEETGHTVVAAAEVVATWLSGNGVYRGYVLLTPSEADFPLDETDPGNREVADPDNWNGRNFTESIAWFDPADLDRGPRILREEVRSTPWALLKGRGPASLLTAAVVRVLNLPGREHALVDGSFPIETVGDLEKAVEAYGRGPKERLDEVRAHIMNRAYELGVVNMIPEEWKYMAASANTFPFVRMDRVDAATMTHLRAIGAVDDVAVEPEIESLVASLAPSLMDALLPEGDLPGPTPYTLSEDRLTADGHLALWASCHIGFPGCVKPPREESFDFYNLTPATSRGQSVGVGRVTVGTGHAGPDLSWRASAQHYDDSGTTVALAHAIPDRWGIRLPSVIVASADPTKVEELGQHPLSGDWRRINGRLRLVASLAVNVPGYPVPMALVASGEVQAMFLGFNPEDAAEAQMEADSLAESLGLGRGARAEALRAAVLG